jgi:hypothetical protein
MLRCTINLQQYNTQKVHSLEAADIQQRKLDGMQVRLDGTVSPRIQISNGFGTNGSGHTLVMDSAR